MSKLSKKVAQVKKAEEELPTTWYNIKSWFKNSLTLAVARVTALSGMITTLVGAMDWSPLWSMFTTGTSFTKQQLIMIGVGVIGLGITTELARRRTL